MKQRACYVLAAGLIAVATGVWAGQAASQRPLYGWPLKPFFEQHPVRGYFGDPRIGPSRFTGEIEHNFHFGIDIAAPDGTPVYATASGYVTTRVSQPNLVRVSSGDMVLEYWHVIPALRAGQEVVAYRSVIGHIQAPFGHVHFAEWRGNAYVNPLRPGALTPYADRTIPRIGDVRLERSGQRLAGPVSGAVDIIVGAIDIPAMPVPDPAWTGFPITPAFVRWRVLGPNSRPLFEWRAAYDARFVLPSLPYFDVYAPGTRQNRPNRRGWYRFYLAHGWNSASVPDGKYTVQVAASDTRSNLALERYGFTIRNRH